MDSFELNVGAMLIVLILGHFTTGILVIAYTAKHRKSTAVNMLLLAKWCQMAAWVLLGLRVATPSVMLKAAGNAVLLAGAAAELIALLILKKCYTRIQRRAYAGVLIVCVAVFLLMVAFETSEGARIAMASVVAAVMMAFPVYVLCADRNASPLQRVIAMFYGVTVLFLLCRAYVAFTTDMDLSLSSTNFFNTGLLLLLYLVMMAGSVGFILLDKEKMDRELLRAASYDGLTNILNRSAFIQRAKEAISLFARRQEPVSYLLVDIDDFKKINDEHGHFAGDIVLVRFADTISSILRGYDLFGRYGGEEFAVLLPGTDGEEAAEIAERLRKAIGASAIIVDSEIRYTISIGVATMIPDRETTVDMLYKLSDNALYVAKMQGKNRVACGVRTFESIL